MKIHNIKSYIFCIHILILSQVITVSKQYKFIHSYPQNFCVDINVNKVTTVDSGNKTNIITTICEQQSQKLLGKSMKNGLICIST